MKTTNPLIIQAPQLQTLKQRYSSTLLTFIFWVFWIYLWQPVISIFAWFFGFKMFERNMLVLGGINGLFSLMGNYVVVVCSIAFLFFGWAYYNNMRFKEKKRRGKIWKVSVDNLGERFALTEDQVLECKTSRRMVVHFNETGKIIQVNKRLSNQI